MNYTWPGIAEILAAQAPDVHLRVEKDAVPHPVHAGLLATIDVPRGQFADYRLPIATGTWLRVSEFADRYEVSRVVTCQEQPSASGSSALLFGALIGLVLGGSIAAALAGAAVSSVADAGAPPSDPSRRAERRQRAVARLQELVSERRERGAAC